MFRMKMAAFRFVLETANKALHANHRRALGYGLSIGLLDAGGRHHTIVQAAFGDLGR